MKFKRSSGILLHPTSLPGPYGVGDIGPQAYQWLDFLAGTGCSLWQVLPLGPTGYGDSPYQCFSSFAGNPYLISPDLLIREGLLFPDDLLDKPLFPEDRVDYGAVIPWKLSILDRSFERFQTHNSTSLKDRYEAFKSTHSAWLNDFALFMAIKETHSGAPWPSWDASLRDHQPQVLEEVRQKQSLVIEKQKYRQFLFYTQWADLRDYAEQKEIHIIGDIPIFVAHDSADVWAHPELFFLDQNGKPTVVAGVPPDYFSATGQLWGNPLYRWKVHKANGYAWWLDRISTVLDLVDFIRLDHFRGFAGYWEVPGKAKTAVKGKWKKGPGKDFFLAVKKALGDLPIIAEDLGVITPDVVAIREGFHLPGMKILQFAFDGGPENPFLPHNYVANCVAYTGTHDNDTVLGWYQRVPEVEKNHYRRYMGRDGSQVSWDLIRGIWASVAMFALAPLQDFLELDNAARMNYPGNPSGNWTWRMVEGSTSEDLKNRILDINQLYGRMKPR
jgi:4-alpha-glucanotransferase